MAPVTRRSHESFTNFNMYNDANEESSNAVTNDPWSIESGNELETGSHSAGFEDSFIVPADPQNDSNVSKSYQKNKEYLEYLGKSSIYGCYRHINSIIITPNFQISILLFIFVEINRHTQTKLNDISQ